MFGPLCPLISSGKTRDMAEIPKNRLLMSSDSHFHLTHSTSLPMVRILAPVLVLLTLLLATGLAALGRYMLQWRKKGEQRWMGVGRRLSAGDRTETCSPLTSPERPRGSGDLSDTLASGVLLLPSGGTTGPSTVGESNSNGAVGEWGLLACSHQSKLMSHFSPYQSQQIRVQYLQVPLLV